MSLRVCFAFSLILATTHQVACADTTLLRGPVGTVTNLDIQAEISQAPEPSQKAIMSKPTSIAQIARNIYVRKGFAQLAETQNLDKDPQVLALLAQARERVLSEAFLTRAEAANTPTEAAALEWAKTTYRIDPKRFTTGKQIRASHILIPGNHPEARKKAEDILSQLKTNPALFESLAKEHSADKGSGEDGGDLGFFGEGRMVKPFDEAAFALKNVGDISDIVVTQFGFHIIKLTDTRAPGVRTFEEVKDGLIREAMQKLKTQTRTAETERLLRDAVLDSQAIDALSEPFRN